MTPAQLVSNFDFAARSMLAHASLRRGWLRHAAWLSALGAFLFLSSGLLVGRLLTARRHPRVDEPPPSSVYAPVRLTTSDGLSIGAWLWVHPEERAAVVLVHGNGASRTAMQGDAERWFALGCTVMPISVRAHGDSEGERNDVGYSARHDVAAAIAYLRRHSPTRRIILHGVSLGAAASLFAAAEDHEIDGLVLIGPYGDLREAIRSRTERYLPWGVETLAYGALLAASPVVLPDLDRIRPLQAAHRVRTTTPMLIVAGELDRRAPLRVAREMAVGHPDARVIVAPALDHEELEMWMRSSGASQALREFLEMLDHGEEAPAP